MSFSTRRGRPAKPKETFDYGTPELRAKHAVGFTAEAIDLCLERRLITREQHWAGLHYRWLYTVRYGAPSLSSHWWRLSGESSGTRSENIDWRASREQEYAEARILLTRSKTYESVMQIAVYNDIPCFLRPDILQQSLLRPALQERIAHEQACFSEGLLLLTTHWRRLLPADNR